MVGELNDRVLAEASTGADISIVDFWAPWCKPCKYIEPHFEELSSEIDGAKFYKVNVNDNAEIAEAYGVLSIPTIVVLKGAKKVGSIEGALPKDRLKDKLEKILGRA